MSAHTDRLIPVCVCQPLVFFSSANGSSGFFGVRGCLYAITPSLRVIDELAQDLLLVSTKRFFSPFLVDVMFCILSLPILYAVF